VPRKGEKAETKIRMTPEEKEWFERAAAASRRSLNQWLIAAGAEKAMRDGVPVDPEKKQKR
jgi:uncharacterized protein (DUF1778 family)